MLGSLPGARSIGESHRLIKSRSEVGIGPIDFDNLQSGKIAHCQSCGEFCEVLTAEFRRALAASRVDWYLRIAQRLDTDLLISSDKTPTKIVDLDPLMRFDALVLYKSPAQAWISHRARLPGGRDPNSCRAYLDVWAETYEIFLKRFRPVGKVVFMSFEQFVRTPAGQLKRLCESLELPNDASVLNSVRPGHELAGNQMAQTRLKKDAYRVTILPTAEPSLSGSELNAIGEHAAAEAIHRALLQVSI